MKKISTFFAKWLLLLVTLCLHHNLCIGQVNTKSVSNQITVSIAGIDYDDPAFSLLKESLQKTKNVASINESYDQGTGKIALVYNSNAQTLWSELPNTTKQFFKVTGIDDNHIALQARNASKENTAAASNNASVNSANDDCKNCYLNLCRYDGLKTFQGIVYKQINKDDGTYYYNCDNGVVVVKQIFKNGYGVITSITNDTLIMSNVPVGTQWGLRSSGASALGLNVNYSTAFTLIAKGLKIEVNGTTYNDVLEVNYRNIKKDFLFGDQSVGENNYYAKGAGLIKSEKVDPNKDPLESIGTESAQKSVVSNNLPGVIDSSIVGSWKYHHISGMEMTYTFRSDGTYIYLVGSDNFLKNETCFWRVNGNMLELAEGSDKPYSLVLQKKNNPVTGKPELVIQFRGNEYRNYFSLDNKAPWQ